MLSAEICIPPVAYASKKTVCSLLAVSALQIVVCDRKLVQCTSGVSGGLWPLPLCRAGSIEWFAEEAKRIYGDIIPVRDLPAAYTMTLDTFSAFL
jgi:hypothetical protein